MVSKNAAIRKRGTNVSLRSDLVTEARELGLSLSSACENGLAAAVKAEKERRWLEENRPALDSWNRYIAEHGLPLAKYRSF
jgi:antitoxin CcdA